MLCSPALDILSSSLPKSALLTRAHQPSAASHTPLLETSILIKYPGRPPVPHPEALGWKEVFLTHRHSSGAETEEEDREVGGGRGEQRREL